MRIRGCFWLILIAASVSMPAVNQAQDKNSDLTAQSLSDLMNIEVTSVSKKEQKLSQTAAAVFVINEDDIRRSAATSIPGLLRMVPGVQVAQIDASTWAISARGFAGQYSNKLLVLIDGRTVYSPLFSGVFWDSQDVPLESIARIEVIRGPGATIWGANAVNGVINITTKAAIDTQGKLLVAGGGDPHLGFGVARYGSSFGQNAHYRISIDGFANNHFPSAMGGSGNDDWRFVNGMFRMDLSPTIKDSVTVQGGAHRGSAGEQSIYVLSINPPVNGTLPETDRFSGWNVLSRWNHTVSSRSDTTLQTYFSRSSRDDTTKGYGLNTFALEFQDHLRWGQRQDIVVGAGYRIDSDHTSAGIRYVFNPVALTTNIFSSFIQDEIALASDRVHVSIGTKLEHNYFTGFGLQPSVRTSWKLTSRSMLWAAISQAERTPARSDTGLFFNFYAAPTPLGIPILLTVSGNPKFKNENLRAYEAGGRTQWTRNFSLDVATYYNSYRDLVSYEPSATYLGSVAPPYLVSPNTFSNLEYGETHGGEISGNWQVTHNWNLRPSYSLLELHIHLPSSSGDTYTIPALEGGSPTHQAQLRSQLDLPHNLEWNTSAYFVDRLRAQRVPSYTRLDSAVSWRATQNISLTLAGENLLQDRHLEFVGLDASVAPSLVKRGVYLKTTWAF